MISGRVCLIIYSFFYRKDMGFILTRDLKLAKPDFAEKKEYKEPVMYAELLDSDEPYRPNKRADLFKKAIVWILLIAFLLTSIPGIKIPNSLNTLTYDEFMKEDLSLEELFITITGRLRYRYDIQDEWTTPRYAWENKFGDCEEFASLICEYLNTRNVENYLVGLRARHYDSGHAVVFIKTNEGFFIIDPTGAVESAGIKRLKGITTLKDAVRIYDYEPSPVYKVPERNGEKEVLFYVFPSS